MKNIFFSQAFLLPLWYPLMSIQEMAKKDIHKVMLEDEPYVCYKNNLEKYILHSDQCPHLGASLSKGWVNEKGNIQCPYHGFEFCDGKFCQIPDPGRKINSPHTFTPKTILPLFPTSVMSDMVFVYPKLNSIPPQDPFFPPEEYEPEFHSISGQRVINTQCQQVVENLLDMLHISYVHSFGNRNTPLPYHIKYEDLSSLSGKTVFLYKPHDNTISNKIGNSAIVKVENEFHLPTNTVTRVTAGGLVKTVFTRALPIGKKKTILFWKIYRNFWVDPNTSRFSWLGDVLLRYLMNKTLDEDMEILKNVYPLIPSKICTRYDITIREYRKKLASFYPEEQ